MEEFETKETIELSQLSTTAPRWTGAPSIELAYQLNRQGIDLVCELAATSSSPELPQFVLRNRDLWRLLESEARRRVAAFPFVIVDIRFKDAESWRRAAEGQLMGAPDCTLHNVTVAKLFEDLVLETLLFARQAARENISVAKTMFAMTSSVANVIASLTLARVRLIAIDNSQQLRIRWGSDPEFWGELLVACRSGDEQALVALRRQAKLRFCGEFVS